MLLFIPRDFSFRNAFAVTMYKVLHGRVENKMASPILHRNSNGVEKIIGMIVVSLPAVCLLIR